MTDIERATKEVEEARKKMVIARKELREAESKCDSLAAIDERYVKDFDDAMDALEQVKREAVVNAGTAAGLDPAGWKDAEPKLDTDCDVAVSEMKDGSLNVKIGSFFVNLTKGQARNVVYCLTERLMGGTK